MNVFVRLVALLIATLVLFLGFLGSTHAYVWNPQDLTTLREYQINTINVPFGSSNAAPNHRVVLADSSMVTFNNVLMSEPQAMETIYQTCLASGGANCENNWRPSGKVWKVFKVGTLNTIPVFRFYIIPLNSHVYVAANEVFNQQTVISILRQNPEIYSDEGPKFAVMEPLGSFVQGKVPLSQACGEESQSGLTAMLRVYNNGIAKPSSAVAQLAVRFNDGNHRFTTRTDKKFMEELRFTPGWEIAVRDFDTTRGAGVWCIPSTSKSIIQTTAFSGMPGDGPNIWLQAQSHEVSQISLQGGLMSLPGDYVPARYFTETYMDQTLTGRFSVDPNTGGFLLTRANGGYVGYGGSAGSLKSLQKAAVIDRNWTAIRSNQETDVIYSVSTNPVTKVHAYNPKAGQYLWQYDVPEQYQSYIATENDVYLAGNYLVVILQHYTPARDNFKSVVFVLGNLSGATPEVQIFDLAGPNDLLYGFTFDGQSNVGYFANARGRSVYKLNFTTWGLSQELVPFEPFAMLTFNSSGDLYATEVVRTSTMEYLVQPGALWKRPLVGGNWVSVSSLGAGPFRMSVVNVQDTPHLMVHQVMSEEVVAFINLKTGVKVPAFANGVFFGGLNWRQGLDVLPFHQ